MSPADRT